MATPLDDILSDPNDSAVCDGLYTRIIDHYGPDIDASQLAEAERVALLVYHTLGTAMAASASGVPVEFGLSGERGA